MVLVPFNLQIFCNTKNHAIKYPIFIGQINIQNLIIKRMKAQILASALILLGAGSASGQSCISYYPQSKGTTLVYQQYDKDGKPAGKSSQEIINLISIPNGTKIEVLTKSYDKDNNLLGERTLEAKCEGGVFYMDMESYISQETLNTYEGLSFTVDAKDLELPGSLKVGDKLKDAQIKLTATLGFLPIRFTVDITERMVEAKESVKTPAGTFEAYKIKQKATYNVILQYVAYTTEWYSANMGLLKSESFSSGGELLSKTELVSFSR
jgi:hypothetical protein